MHLGYELGSAVNGYGAVDLEVEEVLTCECMILVSDHSLVTKSVEGFVSGNICVATQFYIEAVVGAFKP